MKNDGTLPLDSKVKVAVIGDFAQNPRYQGAGSSIVNPTVLNKFTEITKRPEPKNKPYVQGVGTVAGEVKIPVVETIVEDLHEYTLNITGYEKGFDRYGKKNNGLIKKAVKLTEKSDVALLFLGLDEVSEAEGLDREHIRINDNQIELYKALKATGKKIAVVLACGSAVELEFLRDANAFVYACLSGQACADAILNIVTGKVNPSGKLAETFPVKYDDVSTSNYFPGKKMTVEYREGPYIGYRYFDTAGVEVEYPFGYGLSYTTFEYSDIKVDKTGVSFTVTNTGERDGAEISQLYVGKADGKIFRPKKELKGFAKTFIKAGESAKVTIPFDDKTFRYFNVKTNKWEIEDGKYELYVGKSIKDIVLEGEITQVGTTDEMPYDPETIPSYYSGDVKRVSDDEFKTLIGRDIPDPEYKFYKKNRMVIHENCTIADLRYSRGWTGRLFSGAIRFAISLCRGFGMRTQANTLVMGMLHQPVRGMSKFVGFTRRKMEGLLMMFNGHFWKGLHMFCSKEKAKKDKKVKSTEEAK